MPRNELARRVGVAGNHLYMIESGSRMPSLGLVERVAHALRVTPADLVREEPENILTSPKADVPDTGGQPGPDHTRMVGDSIDVSDHIDVEVKRRIERHLNAAIYDLEVHRRRKQAAQVKRVRDEVMAAL
jgi:transcriptional regulator with XRE-family HTH domain